MLRSTSTLPDALAQAKGAHAVARLLAGHTDVVAPEDLPEPFAELRRKVLAAEPGSRVAEFRAAVSAYPNAVALLRAVFVEDPDAPVDFFRFLLSSQALAAPLPAWPDPPAPAAYHGLAGDFVRLIEPHTEADPTALLVQFLVAFGNAIGRSAYFFAEADRHYGNLFAVLVGRSSKGRKGSSLGQVRRVFSGVDETWERHHVKTGLSSGEGLIYAVRDAAGDDPGVSDKRLLAVEPEFALLLRVLGREGNTLSPLLRQAWDAGRLATLTRNSPLAATDTHISMVGHIMADELLSSLPTTQTGNGFANRFLWVCVRRARSLPDGGEADRVPLDGLSTDVGRAVDFGGTAGRLLRDEAARARWHAVYEQLAEGHSGLFGAVTARAEGQVMRLALLYALLDLSSNIRLPHLEAALALWRYCEASALYIFGHDTGNQDADVILAGLQARPSGLTRGEIFALLHNRRSAGAITRALTTLREAGLAECRVEQGRGRPAERWLAIEKGPAKKEESEKRPG